MCIYYRKGRRVAVVDTVDISAGAKSRLDPGAARAQVLMILKNNAHYLSRSASDAYYSLYQAPLWDIFRS